MAETEEKLKETEVSTQGNTQVVRQRTSATSTEDKRVTVANGIWFLAGVVEVLLAFRLLLKLFGANPANSFVSFIYSVSGPLTAPFRGIFSTPTAEGDVTTAVFETSTLVAMLVYALVAWGLVALTKLNKRSI